MCKGRQKTQFLRFSDDLYNFTSGFTKILTLVNLRKYFGIYNRQIICIYNANFCN
ncbi:hypothetical protein MCC93_05870 [Morococcus cerebrosus]|uniref:Uncharacterized protein n=1 Tax=Morococcus cerebrosus TaxID=1056807 RepID=A0A0C1H010_9NEIS|nr:hypothetical protein MCC93_05870 [Morococcus cerebrosus]